MNSKIAKLLATNPHALAKFMRTGKLPQMHVADSPLIRLLLAVGKGHLHMFRGVTVDETLGYTGSRTFPTAAAALHWLQPPSAVDAWHPAESYRIKRGLVRELTLDDLLAKCTGAPPEAVLNQLKHLRAPAPALPRAEPTTASPVDGEALRGKPGIR